MNINLEFEEIIELDYEQLSIVLDERTKEDVLRLTVICFGMLKDYGKLIKGQQELIKALEEKNENKEN